MRQLFLYGVNGVVNTLVSYGVFLVALKFVDYRVAVVVAYLIGMLCSYALNSVIVFRARGRVARFVFVNMLLMLLNLSVTWSLVEAAGWPEELAQLVSILVVFLVGFVVNKLLVFNSPDMRSRVAREERT